MTPDFIVAKGIVRHPATKIGSQFRGHKECFDAALSVRKIAMAVDARHEDAREGLRAERVASRHHCLGKQQRLPRGARYQDAAALRQKYQKLGGRSEARRVENECVSTWKSRWSPYPYKQKKNRNL